MKKKRARKLGIIDRQLFVKGIRGEAGFGTDCFKI